VKLQKKSASEKHNEEKQVKNTKEKTSKNKTVKYKMAIREVKKSFEGKGNVQLKMNNRNTKVKNF